MSVMKKPTEFEEGCVNCKMFLDEEFKQPIAEKNKFINKPTMKVIKVADGFCRRFPQTQPANYEGWCGEFQWKVKNAR